MHYHCKWLCFIHCCCRFSCGDVTNSTAIATAVAGVCIHSQVGQAGAQEARVETNRGGNNGPLCRCSAGSNVFVDNGSDEQI